MRRLSLPGGRRAGPIMADQDELAAAQQQATKFVREYYEDPKAWVEFVEREQQGPRPAYLFTGWGPTVREHRRVRVHRFLGSSWVVEFAD
jgi:hypothetical protein